MKWQSVEPTRGSTTGPRPTRSSPSPRPTTSRHAATPWSAQPEPRLADERHLDPAELTGILQDHITTEVTRYNGKLAAWDVVNEPFNEDGTYRSTIWSDNLGTDYIAQSLTWARAADPTAKLYVNDYNVEGVNAKSTALYNLVKSGCKERRASRSTAVGLQAPPDPCGTVTRSTLQQNIQRFADLGVDVAITELDIRMSTARAQTPSSTPAGRRLPQA